MKELKSADLGQKSEILYLGPDLAAGPFPTFFYFSISASESLTLCPFNQVVLDLLSFSKEKNIRIFSATIPGHEEGLDKHEAIKYWAQNILNGVDLLHPFLDDLSFFLNALFEASGFKENELVLGGLSRGAFIATKLATIEPLAKKILGFSPLVSLRSSKEFEGVSSSLLDRFNFNQRDLEALASCKMRYFIGNNDTRVNTQNSFDLITSIAQVAHEKRIKGGSHQLLITDSIGYMGHGTSERTFLEGADWVYHELFTHAT